MPYHKEVVMEKIVTHVVTTWTPLEIAFLILLLGWLWRITGGHSPPPPAS